MAMELAFRLATNDTLQRYLDKEVVLIAPSMNPDGQRMVTEWYRRTSARSSRAVRCRGSITPTWVTTTTATGSW